MQLAIRSKQLRLVPIGALPRQYNGGPYRNRVGAVELTAGSYSPTWAAAFSLNSVPLRM